MSPSLNPISISLFLVIASLSLVIHPLVLVAQTPKPTSQITVVGAVYCDACHDNSFSRQSYFLPGVDVHVQCKFKANSPKTTEQITFSVNRTTDRYGAYKLEIPSVEGIDCAEGPTLQSSCFATLIQSSSSACNVPALKVTAHQITLKSKQATLCIYSLSPLSFKPLERNITMCGNGNGNGNGKPTYQSPFPFPTSFNSSKFFYPFYPPFVHPWPPFPQFPPLPQLPPLPPLPPFPKLPFPPLPPLPYLPFPPFPFPRPPSLPFPFPPLPPFPPSSLFPPPPPGFNPRDPRTWIPNLPLPNPPPPAFNLGDPRTWIPFLPPTPPNSP